MDNFEFSPEEWVSAIGLSAFCISGMFIKTDYSVVTKWLRVLNNHPSFKDTLFIKMSKGLLNFLCIEKALMDYKTEADRMFKKNEMTRLIIEQANRFSQHDKSGENTQSLLPMPPADSASDTELDSESDMDSDRDSDRDSDAETNNEATGGQRENARNGEDIVPENIFSGEQEIVMENIPASEFRILLERVVVSNPPTINQEPSASPIHFPDPSILGTQLTPKLSGNKSKNNVLHRLGPPDTQAFIEYLKQLFYKLRDGQPCLADFAYMSFGVFFHLVSYTHGLGKVSLLEFFKILVIHIGIESNQWVSFDNTVFRNFIKNPMKVIDNTYDYSHEIAKLHDSWDKCQDFCKTHGYEIPQNEMSAMEVHMTNLCLGYYDYKYRIPTNVPEDGIWADIDFSDVIYYDESSWEKELYSMFIYSSASGK